jgi:methylglutaconyl-CoA hydratase
MSDLVACEERGPATVVTINRADKRNALSRALIAALTDAFTAIREEPTGRCVILTGAGPTFCAGMDLAELRESIDREVAGDRVWDDAQKLANLYDLIYTLPVPTIAAVNGSAVAGGAGLVTVCDLALAVTDAKFGYPEVRRGLVAAMVMPHLLRHVGERMARYLLLSGELIDAETAVQWGLINEAVVAERLMPRAMEWAHALAEGGPLALASTKSLLFRFSKQAVSIDEAAQASAAPRLGDECRAGLRAFFDKKPAPWTMGRPIE